MCINRTNNQRSLKYSEEELNLPVADHPSAEQFNMLLNLLPASSTVAVDSLDHVEENNQVDEAEILMAAVNYILTLTSQLQEKLRCGDRTRS